MENVNVQRTKLNKMVGATQKFLAVFHTTKIQTASTQQTIPHWLMENVFVLRQVKKLMMMASVSNAKLLNVRNVKKLTNVWNVLGI